MFAIAGTFALAGLWMLAQLRRALTPGRTYAYRMSGIMALSGGVVLALSAAAMWQWSTAP
ncbi:hypothetical protein AB5I41_24365 [Sphingomonas sp. MMS24-JH45]